MPECLATQDIRDLLSSQFGLNAKSRGDDCRDLPIRQIRFGGHAPVSSLTSDRDLAVPLRPELSTEHAVTHMLCCGGVPRA